MKSRFGVILTLAMSLGIVVAGVSSYAQQAENSILRVNGSDNVARFVNVYARDYMTAHPDVNIVVVGGKTGTGLRGLLEGRVDLAMASRKMTPQEEETFRQKGMRVLDSQVGWCSIVIVAHPAVQVDSLDKDQITRIFKGEYTNWNQVGGPDQGITVVQAEDSESDATKYFAEHVLHGAPYAKNAAVVTSIQTVLSKVLETEGSIGFCRVTDLEYRAAKHRGSGHGAGHAIIPKILAIKDNPNAPAVLPPTHHDHAMGSGGHQVLYPIRYPLYVSYPENAGGLVKEFVDYSVMRGMGTSGAHMQEHKGSH